MFRLILCSQFMFSPCYLKVLRKTFIYPYLSSSAVDEVGVGAFKEVGPYVLKPSAYIFSWLQF